jgi:hypothetical protein
MTFQKDTVGIIAAFVVFALAMPFCYTCEPVGGIRRLRDQRVPIT